MSDIIKIKRGLKANLPDLALGELGYCTDTDELFIGESGGNTLVNFRDHENVVNSTNTLGHFKPDGTTLTTTNGVTSCTVDTVEYVENSITPIVKVGGVPINENDYSTGTSYGCDIVRVGNGIMFNLKVGFNPSQDYGSGAVTIDFVEGILRGSNVNGSGTMGDLVMQTGASMPTGTIGTWDFNATGDSEIRLKKGGSTSTNISGTLFFNNLFSGVGNGEIIFSIRGLAILDLV